MRIILFVVTIILMIAFLVWFYFNGYKKSKWSTFATDIVLIVISATVIIISAFLRFQTLEEKEMTAQTEVMPPERQDKEMGSVQQDQKSVSANGRTETENKKEEE